MGRRHEAKISAHGVKITARPSPEVRPPRTSGSAPARTPGTPRATAPRPDERDRGAGASGDYQPVVRKIAEVMGPAERTVSPSPMRGVMSEFLLPAR